MSQDFGHSKRRIQEAKKKKREEKRLKKLNRDAAAPDAGGDTASEGSAEGTTAA